MKSTTAAKISLAAIAALGSLTAFVRDTYAAVVINEVYGGGGFAAGTGTSTLPASLYNRDFVELYNNGTAPIDIGGYVFRYGSATSTSVGPTLIGTAGGTIPVGTILPVGGFYLIGGASGTGGGIPLPAIDLLTTVDLSGTSGRVALFTSTSATTSADFVGYGTATAFEGAAATGFGGTAPSGIFSLNRTAGLDSDSNAADFTLLAPTPTASAVPEPAAIGLAAAAGALLVGRRRR